MVPFAHYSDDFHTMYLLLYQVGLYSPLMECSGVLIHVDQPHFMNDIVKARSKAARDQLCIILRSARAQ